MNVFGDSSGKEKEQALRF